MAQQSESLIMYVPLMCGIVRTGGTADEGREGLQSTAFRPDFLSNSTSRAFASDRSFEVLQARLRRRELTTPELDERNRQLQPPCIRAVVRQGVGVATMAPEIVLGSEGQWDVTHGR